MRPNITQILLHSPKDSIVPFSQKISHNKPYTPNMPQNISFIPKWWMEKEHLDYLTQIFVRG